MARRARAVGRCVRTRTLGGAARPGRRRRGATDAASVVVCVLAAGCAGAGGGGRRGDRQRLALHRHQGLAGHPHRGLGHAPAVADRAVGGHQRVAGRPAARSPRRGAASPETPRRPRVPGSPTPSTGRWSSSPGWEGKPPSRSCWRRRYADRPGHGTRGGVVAGERLERRRRCHRRRSSAPPAGEAEAAVGVLLAHQPARRLESDRTAAAEPPSARSASTANAVRLTWPEIDPSPRKWLCRAAIRSRPPNDRADWPAARTTRMVRSSAPTSRGAGRRRGCSPSGPGRRRRC